MTDTQQQPAEQAQPGPAAVEAPTTLEQRTAGILEQLRSDDTAPAEAPVETPAAAPAEAPSDAAAARRARLEQLAAADRARVDHKARQAAGDKAAREAAALKRELDEARARESKRIDPDSLKDPRALLRFAEEHGLSPSALGEAIREAIANPERTAAVTAASEARKAIDPEVKAMREELAELRRRDEQREQLAAQAQAQAAERAAADEFFSFTRANSEAAPRASAFLEKFGANEFYKLAMGAVRSVPEGGGAQAILDTIEENLSRLSEIYSTPSSSKAPPQRAAAKANTVTNALAGARATVVEEEDFASLPFDERVRRVKQRH